MRVKVILNPVSDIGRGVERRDEILAAAEPLGGVDLVLTERRRHAWALAEQAATDGYDVVVAAGGDGTVHEVINGIVSSGNEHVTLGVIPIGTGNDFAYALGAVMDVPTAVDRLFTGAPTAVDLARVEDNRGRVELFQNNFGIGLDAQVVINTESITQVRGFLMYLTAVLKTIAFDYESLPMRIWCDDEELSQETLFMAFGLGPRHGGGFMLTPGALQDDGLVDVCLVEKIGRVKALSLLQAAVKGTHVRSEHVTMRRCRTAVVESDTPLPIHIDGEVFSAPADNVHRVTVTVVPDAIRFMA